MELATVVAADDPDPDVVAGVVEALDFRRGSRQVNRIMRDAADAVWNTLASKRYPEHLTDPALDARLAAVRSAVLARETQSGYLLLEVAERKPADAEALIAALFQRSDIEFNDPVVDYGVRRAYEEFPRALAAALTARLAGGQSLPHRAGAYLKGAPMVDDGPLADAVLDPSTPARRLHAAAAVVGPATVSALFDQLFALDDQVRAGGRYDQSLSDAHARLESALTATRQDVFVRVLAARGRTDNPRHIGLMADLLARHGHEGGDSVPPIAAAHRDAVRVVVEAWIAALLRAPEPVRRVSADVARAAGRLADASLAEPLRHLLERDLVDQAAARAARLAAPTRLQGPDATGYSLMYARAFAAMRDASAIAVLKRDLSDLRWGLDAAAALYEIWSSDHSPAAGIFERWTGAAQHLSARAERSAGNPSTSEFAEAIFAVVRTYGNATNADPEQRHAIALAATGLGLPHGSKRDELNTLLSLPQPIEAKQRLLLCMARSGEIVPAAVLMDGVRNLLEAAQVNAWRLDENRGELMGWIELFPFSDDPTRVHGAIALLPERHRHPHALRRLLEILPQSRAESALATLERLAKDDQTFLQESAWNNALIKVDTEAAASVAIDRLCSSPLPAARGFSRALTTWARKYPKVRSAMIARYRAMPPGAVPTAFDIALDDLADEEIFWAQFDKQVDSPRSSGWLTNTIRNLAIGRRSSDEWKGAFEEFGLPRTQLRARLFAMLPAADARARLAKKCLVAIEGHRDDNGRVLNEPRHPDVATGRPWPPEAEESGVGNRQPAAAIT